MNLIDAIINSLAEASWPIAVVFIVLKFENEIRNVFNRMKKGKIFGQEFELTEEIDQLKKSTEEAAEKIEIQSSESQSSQSQILDKEIQEVIKVAAITPEIGITALALLLEREIRDLATSFEISPDLSIRKLCESLLLKRYLPEQVIKPIKIFFDLRNQIVHGQTQAAESNTLRVLDIGFQLLKIIRVIPHGHISF